MFVIFFKNDVCAIIYANGCKYFRFFYIKPEKVHSPPGAQLEISSKKGGKNILFWTKTYLIWKAGGGYREP